MSIFPVCKKTFQIALAVTLAASSATAMETPPPFASIPNDVNLIGRFEFRKMSALPNLSALAATVKSSPDYSIFREVAQGDIDAIEFGANTEVDENDPSSAMKYIVLYGAFANSKLKPGMDETGWEEKETIEDVPMFFNAEQSTYYSTLSNGAIAMSPQQDLSEKMIAAAKESTPSIAKEGGKLASLMKGAEKWPVFIGFSVSNDLKQQLSDMAENPPPQMAMMSGMPAVMAEAKYLDAMAVVATEQEGEEVQVHVAMQFEADDSANRAVSAFNQLVYSFTMMARMQAGEDPQMLEQIKRIENLKFVQSGNTMRVAIPLPSEMFQQLAMGAQASMMGGMSGFGPGPVPQQPRMPPGPPPVPYRNFNQDE